MVSRRSPRTAARLGAAFVAAVVLLCQAAAWVHGAATPHVTCLEHGESVHLAPAAAGAATDTAADPTVRRAPSEPAAHAHEHCGLQGHRTTTSPSPAPTVALASFEGPAALVSTRAPVATTLLRFAPKTSPPAAPTV
jgi:hypothetical protein